MPSLTMAMLPDGGFKQMLATAPTEPEPTTLPAMPDIGEIKTEEGKKQMEAWKAAKQKADDAAAEWKKVCRDREKVLEWMEDHRLTPELLSTYGGQAAKKREGGDKMPLLDKKMLVLDQAVTDCSAEEFASALAAAGIKKSLDDPWL